MRNYFLITLLLILVLTACGSNDDVAVELEISKAVVEENELIVEGITNLPNGAILDYDINGVEGTANVKEGEWEIIEDIEELDDQWIITDNPPQEISIWVTFAPLAMDGVQPEKVYDVYGEGGINIKSSDNVEELSDGEIKRVIVETEIQR